MIVIGSHRFVQHPVLQLENDLLHFCEAKTEIETGFFRGLGESLSAKSSDFPLITAKS
jgi:hypothetical protein